MWEVGCQPHWHCLAWGNADWGWRVLGGEAVVTQDEEVELGDLPTLREWGKQWGEAGRITGNGAAMERLMETQVLTLCPCNVNVDIDPDKFFQSLLNRKQASFRN